MTLTVRFKRPDEAKAFEPQTNAIEGCIGRGSSLESFLAPTDYWTPDDYANNWHDNLERSATSSSQQHRLVRTRAT